MTFMEDDISKPIETQNPQWPYIKASLLKIDPDSKSFFVLTDSESGSYIQCAGSLDRLTIELREQNGSCLMHYVIGKGDLKSPLNITWAVIKCKVGPILVHDSEVLTISDAQNLFQTFLENREILSPYIKRNITKLQQE
jgi:hypothetical protein